MRGVGALLLNGPVEVLFALSSGCVVFGFGHIAGRRAERRQIDEARAAVWAACEQATAERVRLPGQREAS